MSRLVRRPRTMGCPVIGQSHVDGGIIVGQAHSAGQSPMRRTVRIYNLFRRRYRARRLGIEFRRGANWVLPGEMFVNSMRWAISAPYDNILCWILPLTLDFQRARSEYYPDAIIHTYEPNPSMKKFLNSSLESEALLTF
jgi:hypothetical protein